MKVIREIKNLTQDYVAKQLKMSRANYSNIESSKTEINISMLMAIAKTLDVDYRIILELQPSQILNFTNSPNSGSYNENTVNQLIEQLKIKDEQIKTLTNTIEKLSK